MPDLSLFLADDAATARLGAALSERLAPGDTVLLDGPVGAGKSSLARAVIATRLLSVGRVEDIPSPTFTLVQAYEAGETEIWHADLYRLSDPDELVELGLEDAFATAICLVEWPDRLGPLTPPRHLRIALGDEGAGRRVDITASGPGWARCLEGLPA